jgi:hypothetical protein
MHVLKLLVTEFILGTGARAADKIVDVGRVQEIFNEEWCLQVMYPSLLEWFLGGCNIS